MQLIHDLMRVASFWLVDGARCALHIGVAGEIAIWTLSICADNVNYTKTHHK
jgi:hypothetical protein